MEHHSWKWKAGVIFAFLAALTLRSRSKQIFLCPYGSYCMPRQVAATEQIQRGRDEKLFWVRCVGIMFQETWGLLLWAQMTKGPGRSQDTQDCNDYSSLCAATFFCTSHREKPPYWINAFFSFFFPVGYSLSNKEVVTFSACCALRSATLIFG